MTDSLTVSLQFLHVHENWSIPFILSNCNLQESIVHFDKLLSILCVFVYFKVSSHYCVSLYNSHTFYENTHITFRLTAPGLYTEPQKKRYKVVYCIIL